MSARRETSWAGRTRATSAVTHAWLARQTAVDIELHEPEGAPRLITISEPIEVGRAATLSINDLEVSRRHLLLTPTAGGLLVRDLGSANGTTLDGVDLTEEALAPPGSVIELGTTTLRVVESAPTPTASAAPTPDPTPTPTPTPTPARVPARPEVAGLAARSNDAGSVRYRSGSAGEKVAGQVLSALRKARKGLAGLGSEPWGVQPELLLIDPIPDPDNPQQVLTSGTLLDQSAGRIWMVVTNESPPQPVGRSLALFFGASLPAAADLQVLLEGYGLYVDGLPDPNPELRGQALPTLAAATGDMRATMALSFVRYLIERADETTFRRALGSAQAHRVDATMQDLYGDTLGGLEEAWRLKLAGGPAIKSGQFLRLSVKYLRPNSRRQVEICFYMLLGLGFNVIFPFVTKRLFDHALPSGHFSEVLNLLILLGVAFAISLLAGLRQTQLSAYVSGSVIKQLRLEMFDRLQALPTGWFASRDQSDVLSRMFSDVAVVESGLSQALREGLFQILTLIAEGFVLLRLNFLLGAIVLISAPMVAIIYRLMGKGAQTRSLAVQERSNNLIGVTAENYLAQPVVKAFGLEARERDRFDKSSDRLFGSQRRLALFGGLFGLSVNAVVTLLRLSVLGLGGYLILHHHLTVGGLVAFLGVMGDVIAPVTSLTSMGQALQQCTGALLRVNEILHAESDVVDPPDGAPLAPLASEIRFTSVAFSYNAERQTLDDVTLTIPAGARVAFVGPSGAGKSSVLGLIQRNYDVDDGAVIFDGHDVRSVSLASLRRQISVVFQDTFLFDTTIRENIALGRTGATDAEIEAAAEQAGMAEFLESLPRGLDTLVGERGGRLSGGQRQRVAIARALVRNPSVLILDEATSALDPRTERQIAATLERLSHGRTTIAVTHRLTSVTDYDRIFVVNAGRLVEEGTHAELVAAGGLYSQLWAEQTGGAVRVAELFDAPAALAAIPLFAGLTTDQLTDIAGRMSEALVPAGSEVGEAGAGLVLIASGHGVVEASSIGGRGGVVAELGPGDAYGLSAILGQESGTTLRATEPMRFFCLDATRLAAVAADIPQVAAVIGGSGPGQVVVPRGTQRLPQLTMAAPLGFDDRPIAVAPRLTEALPIDVPGARPTGAFAALPPR